eukprot:Ihof_evm2s811 gene=Ihof_evmTU2s811
MSFADLQKSASVRPSRSSNPTSPISGLATTTDPEILFRQATQNIDLIRSQLVAIERYVTLLTSSPASSQETSKIGLLQSDIKKSAEDTRRLLGRMDKLCTGNTTEQRRKRTQTNEIRKTLDTIMTSYQALKGRVETLLSQSKPPVTVDPITLQHTNEEEQPLLANQTRLIQIQQVVLDNEIDYNEAVIMEREEGIERIHSEVFQVNEMFRDLGCMVHEQGSHMDQIEANISSVNTTTEKGLEELTDAQDLQ